MVRFMRRLACTRAPMRTSLIDSTRNARTAQSAPAACQPVVARRPRFHAPSSRATIAYQKIAPGQQSERFRSPPGGAGTRCARASHFDGRPGRPSCPRAGTSPRRTCPRPVPVTGRERNSRSASRQTPRRSSTPGLRSGSRIVVTTIAGHLVAARDQACADRGATIRMTQHLAPLARVEDPHAQRRHAEHDRSHPREEEIGGDAGHRPREPVEGRQALPRFAHRPREQQRRQQVEDPGELQLADARRC